MIEQSSFKVKRKIKQVLSGISSELSVPRYKFVLEMVSGALSTGSLNIMEISRSLKETIGVKHTHKRLQRHISSGDRILDLSKGYVIRHPAEKIEADSFIYLDGGDLTYAQATSYEQMSLVRDGSSGKIKKGYPLNMIVCRNGSGRVFPVYLDIFHRHLGYTSDNAETYKAIDWFMCHHGSKGIWTMDRGYDSYSIMNYILERQGRFNIRLRGNRLLRNCQYVAKAEDIARGIDRRYRHGRGCYGYEHCYLRDYPVTLIYYKDTRADLLLLNSGHIKEDDIIKQRIGSYFKRWGVEEGCKFIKQSFGLEKAQVSTFTGIRCLLGVVLLSWQVLTRVSMDEELEYIIKKESKMCIRKNVVFDYFRIIKGIMTVIPRQTHEFSKRYVYFF